MRTNVMKKIVFALSVMLVMLSIPTLTSVKAMSYNYDFFKNVVPSAEGLAYDSTYYSTTIKPAESVPTELKNKTVGMDGLKDMEVYNNKIYILNYSTSSITFNLHNEVVESGKVVKKAESMELSKVGELAIVNQEFKWERIINEFPFSQKQITLEDGTITTIEKELVKLLNDYYKFSTPLDEITVAQAKATDATKRAPYLPYSEDNERYAIRLRSPEGITVTKDGIYIADTEGNEILQLNENFEIVNIFLTPNDITFYQPNEGISIDDIADAGTLYRPQKVAVDVSGRVYCIAKDVYEGIIEYAKANEYTRQGTFNRFLGKNEVVANPLKAFWAKIFSEAQLNSLILDLPPMFTNITMDSEGFLYATSLPDDDAESGTTQANMVKIINTAGKDVMKRNGYVSPNGDTGYITASNEQTVIIGPSNLVAVAVNNESCIYTTVDSKRGRLFTYDTEGNLLYITGEQPGGTKTQTQGETISFCLANPIAIDYIKRTYQDAEGNAKEKDLVIVLDASSKSIVVYQTTEFGEYVNEATALYQKGEIQLAEEKWRQVIKINTNYELAYLGIGKSILRSATDIKGYKEAMKYFETAHSAKYYSKAYSLYRDATMRKYFSAIMSVVAVIIVAVIASASYKYIKKKKANPYANEGGDE